jgi:GTP cyclohydrolase I
MNAPVRVGLADVQSQVDSRDITIDAVGIKELRYPITILSGGWKVLTIAYLSMAVRLPASVKGTHMSRFIELLEMQEAALDQRAFRAMVKDMLERLDARAGAIEMRFPYFVRKSAPVSGAPSRLDYDVCWRGSLTVEGAYSFWMSVGVPVTSLYPSSKEISEYGAHNRRSRITIDAQTTDGMRIEELIGIAEQSASCELFGLLKRPDEQFVTEMADDNPKFVEDLVRDVAAALNRESRVSGYTVEAENFESIHNHSAFARLARPARADDRRTA